MSHPAISCYCSTHGRPKAMIENCIYWFLEQDYPGKKELVILNDCGDQTFIFDHPEVRIINLKNQIVPLGKKFNANIDCCRYDVLATWDDDDVFLPHRLSYSVEHMKDGVFHTNNAFSENGHKNIGSAFNYFHSTHLFTRELFNKAGRYNEVDDTSVDVDMMDKLRKQVGNYSTNLTDKDIFYIYRWGETKSHHSSGWGQPNISDLTAAQTKSHIETNHIESGVIQLEPKPMYDYREHLPTGDYLGKTL